MSDRRRSEVGRDGVTMLPAGDAGAMATAASATAEAGRRGCV
jgi:hypothetical protein